MPDLPIVIEVRGIPKPGGSKRHVGNGVLIDSSGKKGADWRGDCKTVALVAMNGRDPIDAPLSVSFTFTFPRPRSHYTSKGLRPAAPTYKVSAPDTTKLIRSIEDALTGIVWKDDSRIVIQSATKLYGDRPGAVVEVSKL
jgi:Holliday junction resolvase RusA-like endonuclease